MTLVKVKQFYALNLFVFDCNGGADGGQFHQEKVMSTKFIFLFKLRLNDNFRWGWGGGIRTPVLGLITETD